MWPFKPPMAKKFGIVGSDNDWRPIHTGVKCFNLHLPFVDKVLGVLLGFCQGFCWIVEFFWKVFTGYPIVFNTGINTNFIIEDIGFYIIKIEIKADVFVIFPIIIITGITFVRTPNLFRCVRVSTECGYTIATIQGRVNTIFRCLAGVGYAVVINKKVVNAGFRQ